MYNNNYNDNDKKVYDDDGDYDNNNNTHENKDFLTFFVISAFIQVLWNVKVSKKAFKWFSKLEGTIYTEMTYETSVFFVAKNAWIFPFIVFLFQSKAQGLSVLCWK